MAYTAIGDIWTVKKKNLLSYLILWIDTNFPRRARSVNSMGGTLQPRRGTRTCFSACYITVKGKKRGPSRGIQVASSDTEGMKKKVNIKRMRPQGGWKKASYNAGVATVKYNAIGAPMTIKLLPLNRHSCVAKAYRNTRTLVLYKMPSMRDPRGIPIGPCRILKDQFDTHLECALVL